MNERVRQSEKEGKGATKGRVVGRCASETKRVALEAVVEVRNQKPPKRRTAG